MSVPSELEKYYLKYSTFSDENNILELFRTHYPTLSKFCPDNHRIHFKRLINSIVNNSRWKKWTNNCGNTDNPPDYYNDSEKMMIEVMRVDHYMHRNSKGKNANSNAENIAKVISSLVQEGRTDILDNYIISGAVEINDHEAEYNYDQYLSSFKRVVEKHINKIPTYKANHPGFKLYFFIFDESASYNVARNESDIVNKRLTPRPLDLDMIHIPCMDENFFSIIRDIDVDQIIWYAPFKDIKTNIGSKQGLQIMIIDPHKPIETIKYNPKFVICSEVPGKDADYFASFKHNGMRVFTVNRRPIASLSDYWGALEKDI